MKRLVSHGFRVAQKVLICASRVRRGRYDISLGDKLEWLVRQSATTDGVQGNSETTLLLARPPRFGGR